MLGQVGEVLRFAQDDVSASTLGSFFARVLDGAGRAALAARSAAFLRCR
jgi:hypothetical protein